MEISTEAKIGRRLRKSIEAALTAGGFLFAAAVAAMGLHEAPIFDFLNVIVPIKIWAVLALTITVVRAVFIWVNGAYKNTLKARQLASIATFGVIWFPLITSFLMNMFVPHPSPYPMFPGIILSSLVAGAEVLVLFALTALEEARRDYFSSGSD